MKSLSSMRRTVDAFLAFHGLPSDTPYMLTAGAALYVWGLRDTYTDIDVIVPDLDVEHASMVVYGQEIEGGNLPSWRTIPMFDVDRAWRDRRYLDGVWVMSLPDLLRFKVALNRPKDQADIQRLLTVLRSA
jgi:hypothetical protein